MKEMPAGEHARHSESLHASQDAHVSSESAENKRPGGDGPAKDVHAPEVIVGGLPNVYSRKLERMELRTLRLWEGVGKSVSARANFRYWTF